MPRRACSYGEARHAVLPAVPSTRVGTVVCTTAGGRRLAAGGWRLAARFCPRRHAKSTPRRTAETTGSQQLPLHGVGGGSGCLGKRYASGIARTTSHQAIGAAYAPG